MLPAPDPLLIRTLAEAHVWARSLRAGKSLTEIASATGQSEPYIRTRIPRSTNDGSSDTHGSSASDGTSETKTEAKAETKSESPKTESKKEKKIESKPAAAAK